MATPGRGPRVYGFGDFRLEPGKRLLIGCDGRPVSLGPKSYDTLAYLVEHAGAVVEKDELLEAIWPDTAVEENNLTQNISLLRRALGEGRDEHRYIVSVPGRGYQFVAPVQSAAPNSFANGSASAISIAVLPFVNLTATWIANISATASRKSSRMPFPSWPGCVWSRGPRPFPLGASRPMYGKSRVNWVPTWCSKAACGNLATACASPSD